MSYREYLPSPALASYVDCYWTRPLASEGETRVLPDGCIDFLFDVGAPASSGAFVVGTMSRALLATGSASWVAVRFRPAGARAFLGVPAQELTDRRVELASALPEARHWLERIASLRTASGRVRALDGLLVSMLPRSRELDARVLGAVAAMENARGNARVEALSDALGVSRQHLKRLFEREVGVGVKTFARIVRMQRVVARLTRGPAPPSWAELALEAGYFDQSHLVNDFRALNGLTPERWARSISPRRPPPTSARVPA